MLKTQISLKDESYDVYYYPLVNIEGSLDKLKVITALNDVVEKYRDDFSTLLEWSSAVQENLGNEVVDIKCNSFRFQEIRIHKNKESQFLVSADFSLQFLSDKNYQAKEIKDIIQLHGIRYSRGYRYWFLFEMSQNFLQLYMFPYYRYNR